jgi:multicomponent Na+:H+ antiporter subunit F
VELFVTAISIVLVILAFLCLISAYRGPTVVDRIVSINLIGTKTVIIMALVAYMTNSPYYLDVALVYALIAFLATLGLAKFLEKGHLG